MNCVVNPPTLVAETLHRSRAIALRTAGVSAVLVATAGTALHRFLVFAPLRNIPVLVDVRGCPRLVSGQSSFRER